MAKQILPHGSTRAPRAAEHSPKQPISGRSRTVTPCKVIQLGGPRKGPPSIVNGRVPPTRTPNQARRSREYLTQQEVDGLIEAARKVGRHGHRDATLTLLAYRHALRVAELVALRWDQVSLSQGLLHVTRAKNGTSSTHPLRGPEIRALRKLMRDYPDTPHVFVTERKGRLQCRLYARSLPVPVSGRESGFRSIRTCYGTLAGSSSPMTVTTPGRSGTTWDTRTFSIRSGTRS